MNIIKIKDAGKNYTYKWPTGLETYDHYVRYLTRDEKGEHDVIVAFGKSYTYGKDRIRVVVFIDGHPHAEFLGADDFESSGEVLTEIKVPGKKGERTCKYPNEPVPERYAAFNVVGLPLRVKGPRVRRAWAVVANIADHKTIVLLAALRRKERWRK